MRLVLEPGKPIAQMARDLGINEGWSEIGPWLLRQIYAVCATTASALPTRDQA